MTYSIVARDPATGRFGVAVQSHWFAVGRIVPWAEAGVGAVATQSFAEASYGPLALDLMRRGKSAREAMDALLLVDDEREARQVAIVDAARRRGHPHGRGLPQPRRSSRGRRLQRAGQHHGARLGVAGHGRRRTRAPTGTSPIACSPPSEPRRPRAATSEACSPPRS